VIALVKQCQDCERVRAVVGARAGQVVEDRAEVPAELQTAVAAKVRA
jgi:hypothetical protein